jgi:hypothetical protein
VDEGGTMDGMGATVASWLTGVLGAALVGPVADVTPDDAGDPRVSSFEMPPTAPPIEPDPPAPPAPAPPPRGHPILILGVGPHIGPHAFGNEECRADERRCEKAGAFLGFGLSAEVRPRLWRLLHAHVRPWIVSNVAPGDRVYRGAAGIGVGLGAYGQRVFGRGEYIPLATFGDNAFEPPFFDGQVGRDTWGHHAGMVAVGFRHQFTRVRGGGFGLELWGGPMFGPRSVRTIAGQDPDRRTLITFMIGLNATFDVVKDKSARAGGS